MNAIRNHALDIAAFVWGVAEATLFFFVPDVLLSYIGVKRGAQAAARASLIAAIGASIGGIVMYLWSAGEAEVARQAVADVPAITESMIARAEYAMSDNWFYATFLGPLSSTPFKVYAILAPHVGAPLWAFAIASIVARLPRFLLVSLGVSVIGAQLRKWLSERAVLLILLGAWIVFYTGFFLLMPSAETVTFE